MRSGDLASRLEAGTVSGRREAGGWRDEAGEHHAVLSAARAGDADVAQDRTATG